MMTSAIDLTQSAIDFYQDNGYWIAENALSSSEIAELNAETTRLCRGEGGEIRGVLPASAQDSDEDILKRYHCIHFPHKISELMKRYLAHPAIVETLTHFIGANVKCMQSMLFIKAAGKPGQAWHQDEFYIPTRDRSLTGAWIALDDATIENGCLWVIPKSHKLGILWDQREHNDPDFDCAGETYDFPYKDEDAIPVEVKAGSILFFNGYLLHRSLPNRANSGYRRVLVNHYMSAESLLPWYPKQGEHLGKTDYRDIVIIAGNDPYSYKGYENIAQPHLRHIGDGGCSKDGK